MTSLFKKRHLAGLAAFAAACALTLSACGGGDAPKDNAGDKPEAGPTGTLNVAAAYATTDFNPANNSSGFGVGSNWQVVEGLWQFDMTNFKIYPALAAGDPEKVSDTEYNVKLRDGAKFSDGTDVKAADVVKAYERAVAIDPDYEGNLYKDFLAFVDSVSAADDTTVNIKLKYPFPKWKERFTNVKVVPASATKDDLTNCPIGTGPYMYDCASKTDTSISAVVNPNYNGPKPAKVEKINWTEQTDAAPRLTAALSGEISIMEDVQPDAVKQLEGKGWKVEPSKGFATGFILFNTQKAPFDKKEVRQAFLNAIDYASLVKNELAGNATVATSFLPKTNPDYSKAATQYSFNPEKAKTMLASAGASNLKVHLVVVDNWIKNLAPAIAENLKAAGITANVDIQATKAVYSKDFVDGGNFDVLLAPGDPSVFGNDPALLMNWWYADNVWTQARNGWAVSSPDQFQKLQQIITEGSQLDGDEAKAKWKEAQDFIADEVPMYLMFHRTVLTGYNPAEVDGVTPVSMTGLQLVDVSVK